MHIVTLSFDDGFRKSNLRIADIYERFGLSACFNVLAAQLPASQPPDEYHAWEKGDFDLWNALQERGHEIMPHGYRHANLARMPFSRARDLILRCLHVFAQEVAGFVREEAVYNFAYNASTRKLEAWLPTLVRAFRTRGDGLNPLPNEGTTRLTCTGFGPGNCEHHLDEQIDRLLSRAEGWLIYNTHGLDDEGWGPIGSDYLERLLERLAEIETVRVLPAGRALALCAGPAAEGSP
jgi:peptidoglycan/xylan/chitin deacetylase (PgdA/CDA1 family)